MKELKETFSFLCKKYIDLYNKVGDLSETAKTEASKLLEHVLDRLRSADKFIENRKSYKIIKNILKGIENELELISTKIEQLSNINDSQTEG